MHFHFSNKLAKDCDSKALLAVCMHYMIFESCIDPLTQPCMTAYCIHHSTYDPGIHRALQISASLGTCI